MEYLIEDIIDLYTSLSKEQREYADKQIRKTYGSVGFSCCLCEASILPTKDFEKNISFVCGFDGGYPSQICKIVKNYKDQDGNVFEAMVAKKEFFKIVYDASKMPAIHISEFNDYIKKEYDLFSIEKINVFLNVLYYKYTNILTYIVNGKSVLKAVNQLPIIEKDKSYYVDFSYVDEKTNKKYWPKEFQTEDNLIKYDLIKTLHKYSNGISYVVDPKLAKDKKYWKIAVNKVNVGTVNSYCSSNISSVDMAKYRTLSLCDLCKNKCDRSKLFNLYPKQTILECASNEFPIDNKIRTEYKELKKKIRKRNILTVFYSMLAVFIAAAILWCTHSYEINYDCGIGTLSSDMPTNYNFISNDLALPDLKKDGYEFKGWYDNPELKGNAVTKISLFSYGNKSFYAKWEAISYDIIYHLDGGENNSNNPTNFNHDQNILDLYNPKKVGYTFIGWYNNPSFTGNKLENIKVSGYEAMNIYAKWEANEYKISFDYAFATGDCDIENIKIKYDGTIEFLPAPTKIGSTFDCWIDKQTGKKISIGDVYNFDENIELVASWNKIDYKITFDLTGGVFESSVDSVVARYDEVVTLLPNPTKIGYFFVGWFDASGNIFINDETIYKYSDDIVLYAKWEANTYNIYFENIDSSLNIEPITAIYNEEISGLPHPLVEDKIFVFWLLNDEVVAEGDIYTFAKDITLTAAYSNTGIKFDYNGGTGLELERDLSMKSVPVFGELPIGTKEGYDFAGWYYDKERTLRATSNSKLNDKEIVVLYASWQTTITFDYQDATGNNSITDQVVYYNLPVNKYISLPVPIKDGYEFGGWYTSPSGNGENILDSNYIYDKGIKVYAKWTTELYFMNNDRDSISDQVDVIYGTPVNLITPIDLEGFEFKGWYLNDNLITSTDPYVLGGEASLIPVWNSYIELNYNDATVSDVDKIEVIYLEKMSNLDIVLEKESYEFAGWYYEDNLFDINSICDLNKPSSLTAKWKGEINYNLENDVKESIYFYYGDDLTKFNYTTLDFDNLGWSYLSKLEFVGWYKDDVLYEFLTNYKGNGDISLTAKYLVEISYEYNGATSANATLSTKIMYKDNMGISLIIPERIGYTFGGWYYEESLETEVTNTDICLFTDNIKIYAKWIPNTYSVTLDYGLASGELADVICTFDGVIDCLPDVYLEDYVFVGWKNPNNKIYNNGDIYDIAENTSFVAEFVQYGLVFYSLDYDVEPHPTGKIIDLNTEIGELPIPVRPGYTFLGWYDDSDVLYDENTVITEMKIIKLYSKWDENSYEIKFDNNGGIGVMPNEELLYTEEYVISDVKPSKTGYEFMGWSRDFKALEAEFIIGDSISKLSLNDGDIVTLYAVWKACSYVVTFNYDGGVVVGETVNVTYDSYYTYLPVTEKVGYTFAGWYLDSEKIEENSIVKTSSNHTLDAKWTANKYIVTYGSRTKEVTYDQPYGALEYNEIIGYDFLYWEYGNYVIYETSIVKTASDHELKARYQLQSFVVTYEYNGGTGKGMGLGVSYGYPYGELETPYRENYVFKGWEYNGQMITKDTLMTTLHDHTLVAKWEGIDVTVKFNYNGGSGSVASSVVKFGGTYGSLPTPSSYTSGDYTYTFSHWSNSGGTKITKDSTVTNAATHTLTANWNKEKTDTECFVKGSLITMADGSTKKVEDLVLGEEILVFNHETGKLDASTISYIFYNGYKAYKLLNLYFADDVSVNVLFGHGFFDRSINEYVVITPDNVLQYIGHEFYYTVYENGSYIEKWLTLDSYDITFEYTECYSILSAITINHFVNGMLAVSDDIEGLYNIFDLDENMKVIEENKLNDYEVYGKFTYDDWKEYISYEEYVAFGAENLLVSIGKGLTTYENLLALIERFL